MKCDCARASFMLASMTVIAALMARVAGADVVQLNPGDNIQNAISAHPAGSIFNLAPGVWHQQWITHAGNNNQFIGDPNGGTILTGDDTTEALYTYAESTGVLWKNITVEHYHANTADCFLGAIHGPVNWTFDHATFTRNNCSGLNMGSGSTVIGGHYTYNAHAGIQSAGSSGVVVRGAEIAWNNTRGDDPYNDASGLKFANASNVTLTHNYVHDNASVGLWCDIHCTNVSIDGNTLVHNTYEGIRYEISSGTTTIRNNVANDNGSANHYPQIGIWSSDHVEVSNNNVKAVGNEDGIIVQADPRPDAPAATTQVNSVHNNIVTFTVAGSHGGYGFRNYGGPLGTGGMASLSFDNNAFYVPTLSDVHWVFNTTTNPVAWNSYRSAWSQDAHSILVVGDGSVPGCQQTDCNGTVAASTPFLGKPAAIPGVLLAQNFDMGGEGLAFHIPDPSLMPMPVGLRPEAVGLKACSDTGGGSCLGYNETGKWLAYTVNVAIAGSYALSARVAAGAAGGVFHVEVDGTNVTGALAVPVTGAWDTAWTTIHAPNISLSAGPHIVRVVTETQWFDLNYLTFTAVAPPFAQTLKATSMAVSPAGAGGAVADGTLELWSQGSISQAVNFPAAKTYSFAVTAYGSIGANVWPNMQLTIDEKVIGNFNVNKASLATYTATTSLSAGSHVVAVAFTNDYYAPPEDRNLWVGQVQITAQ